MPTEKEKQAEKERVTRSSGFRMGIHDFMAEVDLDYLKKRNDKWESEHGKEAIIDRKTDEIIRMVLCAGMRTSVAHIQIHVHAAHKAGATPDQLRHIMDVVANYAGAEARQYGLEAWRLVFRPDLPSIFRVVELTDDSFTKK